MEKPPANFPLEQPSDRFYPKDPNIISRTDSQIG